MRIFTYSSLKFTKKVIFLFFLCTVGIAIAIFYLYVWLFPSLDDQLFKATKEKCALQSFCKVHLHEITNFKWDKAYFFSSDNYYSNQDIKKITGVSFDLQKYKTVKNQEHKTLAIFIYHGKLVKYSFFEPYLEPDYLDSPSKSQYFDMLFFIDLSSSIFQDKGHFGTVIKFKKNFQIAYYEITPINDLLYISFFSHGSYYKGYTTEALALCSNLNQVHLR